MWSLTLSEKHVFLTEVLIDDLAGKSGADPGFFLGGGALISCSTSTPINHIVFLAEYQLYYKTAGHPEGGGGAPPAASP